jgi:stringent starvation protein B
VDVDTAAHLNSLKKHVFCELLRIAGRVFVLVRYSEHVVLGNRSFNAEEKKKGIVLVFNSGMHFQWDEYGITATLVFGSSPQKCFIPVDDIAAVYSHEVGAQFIVSPLSGKLQGESTIKAEVIAESPDNVIKVDFKKKQLRHDADK